MATSRLCLHKGAREVRLEDLRAVPCPPPEGRWRPVPHHEVAESVGKALTDAGYHIDRLQTAVSGDSMKLFGVATLRSPLASGVHLAVGFRSSLDKSISLQWCCGSRVFVCDNLAFLSEQIIARKHTTHGAKRYQEAICQAVSQLAEFRDLEAARIRRMQHRIVSDHFAEAFLLRAYQDEGILSPRSLPVALKEWREPSFEEFAESKSAWRLFNACTFALGERAKTNPQAHARATIRLGAVLEGEASPATLPYPAA